MKYSTIISTFLIFISCEKNKNDVINKDVIEVPKHINDLRDSSEIIKKLNNAVNDGNEKVYNEIAGSYILTNKYQDLLYYSLIMANKYNSAEAHYHIFLILAKNNFNALDKKTKNLALFYLIRSNELGYKSAKYSVDEIIQNGRAFSSSHYLNEYDK